LRKICLDTNVFISALLFPGGAPEEIIFLVKQGVLELTTSEDILAETSRVLTQKFSILPRVSAGIIKTLREISICVTPSEKISIIKADPPDNRILECAVEGEVDFIISGDKHHLLKLGKFRGIPILGPGKFLRLLAR
jgi:putative PIN family toxin of toxin-antitoxin system